MAAKQTVEGQAAPSALSLRIVLHCTKTEEEEEKAITFKSIPTTVLDIKIQIEKQHRVPVCVQVLSYDGHILSDSVEVSALKVRNGDTLHVKYLAKGHCSEICDIINWLTVLSAALEDKTPCKGSEMDPTLERVLSTIADERMIEDLAFKYFFPWLEPNTYVNKLHFVYNNGIEPIMKIHEALLRVTWHDQSLRRLKYLEYTILRVLWNFAETFPLRRLVIQNRGIKMCTQSMLRVNLDEEQMRRPQYMCSFMRMRQALLLETIVAAVGVLCNLSEVPECHLEIASNEDALHQLTCLSLNTTVRSLSPQLVATMFLCLAFTPETHKHLTNQTFIRRLLDAYRIPRIGDDQEIDQLLLKYFTLVFLAQVALASPHCIPQDYREEIISEMKSFLQTAHYQTVMDSEIKRGYMWCTFLPFIKLAYLPAALEEMSQLQLISLQLIIFSLQNMLGRDNHRAVVLKEELLDYVICMPQYVPASLRPQAEELVRMVASSPDIPEGPPKLLNLVKARLAKMYFGLEQVLSLSVSEIVSKVLPT